MAKRHLAGSDCRLIETIAWHMPEGKENYKVLRISGAVLEMATEHLLTN